MPVEPADNLKVLHIGKYFPPSFGGIETFMSQLMVEQQKLEMDVAAIVHQSAPDYKCEQQSWNGCQVYNVKSHGQVAYAPMAPKFLWVLRRALDEIKPDIIHIHLPNLSAFWVPVLSIFSRKKSKWIIHWHADVLGAVPDLKVKILYPLYRVFERWLLKKADAVICTSPNYLESSKPLFPYRNKCHVVPLGISIPAGSKELGISESRDDNTLRLICIGRLTYYKGHALLFEAIKLLKAQGKKIILDVVGEGELKAQLKSIVSSERLEDCILFHGGVSENEKYRLLNQADMLCLPSIERTEAFGVVLLEAAALGKPALVSDVKGSGMSFVVQHQKSGLVVKSNSVESLFANLAWASEHIEQLNVFGQTAQLRFNEEFTIKKASQMVNVLYSSDIDNLPS
jgi:glycosyltransferase involved in cell wall biosynthesis